MNAQAIMCTLSERGISVQVLPDNVLRLTPASALTNQIRDIVRAHKADIIAELVQMTNESSEARTVPESQAEGLSTGLFIPCPDCRRDTLLNPCQVDCETSENTGQWFRVQCGCGYEGYICDRDYQRWRDKQKGRLLSLGSIEDTEVLEHARSE